MKLSGGQMLEEEALVQNLSISHRSNDYAVQ